MSIFGAYSRYYNLLYKDKDYPREAEYVHSLIRKHQAGAKSILDLGCGTGRHDLLLTQVGYEVTGVDQSEAMLAVASSQRSSLNPQSPSLNFLQGDIRTVRLSSTFDVVISLFHVMSYQVTTADLQAAFATARAHLKPGGVFIFDCWYGPAVLTDRPTVRVKRLEDEVISVTRIAEPVMHPNGNLVDVNYQVFIRDKASDMVEELRETHRMRYLFLSEIELFSAEMGLNIIESAEWLTGKQPGFDTWGVCFVVRG
ncbi:MAG: SAM-dependent methyltransferase [Geobacter sp.]|nr:MAG: SAM-dependent methyltransferase [Geobacter sp.]